MPQTTLPGEALAMTSQAADQLLRLDSGDAALLYLHLLRRRGLDGLPWTEGRLQGALDQLRRIGLAPDQPAAPAPAPLQPAPVLEEQPPDYATEDISRALADAASTFPLLADEVERRLGKKLSASDLKTLYTLYDHIALPAEVILLLVNWCIEEMERKYGPGRTPFLSQIRREGFIWARQGVDTLERAEEHIARLTRLRSRGAEVLRLLDIEPHRLVQREEEYIAAWDDMGFEDGAIRLAYEKTVLKKQTMNWSYMNAILKHWHEKGLHTAAAIREKDRGAQPRQAVGRTAPPGPDQEQRTRENMARTRRLMEQMKQEEN